MSLNLKILRTFRYIRKFSNLSACPCNRRLAFGENSTAATTSPLKSIYFSTSTVTEKKLEEGGEDQENAKHESSENEEWRDFDYPENAKVLKVAIIGVPNAGKSTLINALTNYQVCPVSRKPHTTRKNQRAVYLNDETQLIFVDTPGLVSVKEIKKFRFPQNFVYGPEKAFNAAHLIAVVHDVANARAREKLDFRIKAVLQKFPEKKSILILNKVDEIKRKGDLLNIVKYLTCGIVSNKPLPIDTLEDKKPKQSHLRLDTEAILKKAKDRQELKEIVESNSGNESIADHVASRLFNKGEMKRGLHQLGWPNFHDVFMVSAINGDGVDLVRDYMLLNAVPDKWDFDSETLTDVPTEDLAVEILKAQLLDSLPQEMPFKVKSDLEHWGENEKGILCVRFKIRCPREKYVGRIHGTGGVVLTRITNSVETILCKLLNRAVKVVIEPVFDKQLAGLDKAEML